MPPILHEEGEPLLHIKGFNLMADVHELQVLEMPEDLSLQYRHIVVAEAQVSGQGDQIHRLGGCAKWFRFVGNKSNRI